MRAKPTKMKNYKKQDFPVEQIRRFIEPGPIVLVSSAWKAERNIMTMGWHMVMEFSPSLIGAYIWTQNHTRPKCTGKNRNSRRP
jgi:flavin reductase (DIM6/NTAB) family NADH-FMN oxidoreductase RutF